MNKKNTRFCLQDISISSLCDVSLQVAVALEGVPHRRKADTEAAPVQPSPREVLAFEQVRDLVARLDAGPDMALRVARAVETAVIKQLGDETVELLEVVRTLVMMAHELNFRPRPTKDNPDGMPLGPLHPLHHTSPVVQQARKLVERHGYAASGQPYVGAAKNPEQILLERERGEKDYMDTYRWLLSKARERGYPTVHLAIECAPKN